MQTSKLSLDNLPDEIYQFYLFRYLDLDDLFELSYVSKTFLSIVKRHQVIELSFARDYLEYDQKEYWFSTTESTRFRNLLPLTKLAVLLNSSFNLFNLKKLRIYNLHSVYHFKLEYLNRFSKLEILQLEKLVISSDDRRLLKHSGLKALSIRTFLKSNDEASHNSMFSKCDASCLMIDTPKLLSLSVRHDGNVIDEMIKFECPSSIKYLRIQSCVQMDIFSLFNNLEILELGTISGFKSEYLSKFKSLKKLKINYRNEDYNDKLKELFLFKDNDLEIILDGVRISDVDKINEPRINDRLHYQMLNYNALEDDLNYVGSIRYNDLIYLLSNSQPADLFRKYNNIQWLIISGKVQNENHLLTFISQSPNLFNLRTDGSLLSQQFFDKLPAICTLTSLRICEISDGFIDKFFNFKFITRMPYLIYFYTDQELKIYEELKNLKYLRKLNFAIRSLQNRALVRVEKVNRDKYLIHLLSDSLGPPLGSEILSLTKQKYALDELNEILNRLKMLV